MIRIHKEKNKDFTLLNLSDPQLRECEWGLDGGNPARSDIFKHTVDELIERVKPDLITITGDLAYPHDMRSYDMYAEYFDKFNIPWTVLWGNHDNQIDLEPIDEMVVRLSKSKSFFFEAGPRELGSGNFVIAIEEDDKIVEGIVMMDTHDALFYLPHEDTEQSMADKNTSDLEPMPTHKSRIEAFEKRGYTEPETEWMNPRVTKKQVKWFSEQIEMLKELGCNDTSLFTHVPIHVYKAAFEAAFNFDYVPREITVEESYKGDCWNEGYKDSFGIKHHPSNDSVRSYGCHINDDGMFDAIKKGGTTKTVLAGHCHVNNFFINYEGVRVGFTLKTGPGCSWRPYLNGGTVLKIDENGVRDLYHEYVDVTDMLHLLEK